MDLVYSARPRNSMICPLRRFISGKNQDLFCFLVLQLCGLRSAVSRYGQTLKWQLANRSLLPKQEQFLQLNEAASVMSAAV